MSAELNQTEKSSAVVATEGDGDNAVVVVESSAAKKRQSLSDIFTIVSFRHDFTKVASRISLLASFVMLCFKMRIGC